MILSQRLPVLLILLLCAAPAAAERYASVDLQRGMQSCKAGVKAKEILAGAQQRESQESIQRLDQLLSNHLAEKLKEVTRQYYYRETYAAIYEATTDDNGILSTLLIGTRLDKPYKAGAVDVTAQVIALLDADREFLTTIVARPPYVNKNTGNTVPPAAAGKTGQGPVIFVSLQRALHNCGAGKKAKETLGNIFQGYQTTITARQEKLQERRQKLDKELVLLGESARAEKEREFQAELQALQATVNSLQVELQGLDKKFTEHILEKLTEGAGELQRQKGSAAIFEAGEEAETEFSSVVSGSFFGNVPKAGAIDLTDDLIRLVDADQQFLASITDKSPYVVPVPALAKAQPAAVPTAQQNIVATDAEAFAVRLPKAVKSNRDGVAIIVGNRNYAAANRDVPDVDYAISDAEAIYRYVTETLGFRAENVMLLKDATQSDLLSVFGSAQNARGQLFDWVRPGISDVFVYYSGHGAPSLTSGQGFLLPVGANPLKVELTGYPLETLYANLAKIPSRSVTIVIDACFSGSSSNGAVVKSASSISLKVVAPNSKLGNASILTAAGLAEVASWDQAAGHGLFTRYFLEGVSGAADQDGFGNGDRRVTLNELKRYLEDEVKYRARRLYGRDQHPQIIGNPAQQLSALN